MDLEIIKFILYRAFNIFLMMEDDEYELGELFGEINELCNT